MCIWFNEKFPISSDDIMSKPFFCLRDYDLNVKSDFMPMVNNLSIDAFIDLVKTYIGIFRKNE